MTVLSQKIEKIRDFIAYQYNLIPEDISVNRNELIVDIEKIILMSSGYTKEDIEKGLEKFIDNKDIKINIIE